MQQNAQLSQEKVHLSIENAQLSNKQAQLNKENALLSQEKAQISQENTQLSQQKTSIAKELSDYKKHTDIESRRSQEINTQLESFNQVCAINVWSEQCMCMYPIRFFFNKHPQ